jgi:uncharacterized membrane protein YsdA (DUF1294 family)
MAVSFLFFPVIIYAGLNILAFAGFTHDKLKSKINRGRNAENTLLLLAALGPIGAMTAMVGFRHKTHRVKFVLVPVFVILHLLLVVWLWPQIAG